MPGALIVDLVKRMAGSGSYPDGNDAGDVLQSLFERVARTITLWVAEMMSSQRIVTQSYFAPKVSCGRSNNRSVFGLRLDRSH